MHKKSCEICGNISEIGTFTSTVTGKTCKMNKKLDCDDKC